MKMLLVHLHSLIQSKAFATKQEKSKKKRREKRKAPSDRRGEGSTRLRGTYRIRKSALSTATKHNIHAQRRKSRSMEQDNDISSFQLTSSRIFSEPTERSSIGRKPVLHDGPIVYTWVYIVLESVLRDRDGNTVMMGARCEQWRGRRMKLLATASVHGLIDDCHRHMCRLINTAFRHWPGRMSELHVTYVLSAIHGCLN